MFDSTIVPSNVDFFLFPPYNFFINSAPIRSSKDTSFRSILVSGAGGNYRQFHISPIGTCINKLV